MNEKLYHAFDSIKANEHMKASTKQLIRQEAEKQNRKHFARQQFQVLAVCMMLFLVIGIGGFYGVSVRPVSYVSIDVNPSIELSINCFDKVIKATAYNEDGEKILENVSVKGMYFEDALDRIVESDAMQAYLTEEALLTFTVASKDSDKEASMSNAIENCTSCRHHGGVRYSADFDSVDKAHVYGLSVGKYEAYLKLNEYDSVTVEDCKKMSMAEIHHQIKEHESGQQKHNRKHGHE